MPNRHCGRSEGQEEVGELEENEKLQKRIDEGRSLKMRITGSKKK